MNLEETADLLAKIQLFDNRNVTPEQVKLWAEALTDVQFGDAWEAVTVHYRDSPNWIMPAHIRALTRASIDYTNRSVVDGILGGPDYWTCPPPPPGLSIREETAWKREQRRIHDQERADQARNAHRKEIEP